MSRRQVEAEQERVAAEAHREKVTAVRSERGQKPDFVSGLQGVKALTSLASAVVSVMPGANKDEKAAALTEMILRSHAVGERLRDSVDPATRNRTWTLGFCTEVAAGQLAAEAIRTKQLQMEPLDQASEVISRVYELAGGDVSLSVALSKLVRAPAYEEADTEEIARDRIALSTAAAAWKLRQAVASVLVPGTEHVFAYGRSTDAVTGMLLQGILERVSSMSSSGSSVDHRVASIQGDIQRVTDLVGANYVAATRFLIQGQIQCGGQMAELDAGLIDVIEQAKAEAFSTYASIKSFAKESLRELAPLAANRPKQGSAHGGTPGNAQLSEQGATQEQSSANRPPEQRQPF